MLSDNHIILIIIFYVERALCAGKHAARLPSCLSHCLNLFVRLLYKNHSAFLSILLLLFLLHQLNNNLLPIETDSSITGAFHPRR